MEGPDLNQGWELAPQHHRTNIFDHQCSLLEDLRSKGETMETLHVLRHEEVILASTWFNFRFTDQSSPLCGLSDLYCTLTLAIEERNALES